METFSDFNDGLFRRFADTQNPWVWTKSLKPEWLKLENKNNSKECLFYHLKFFWNLFWGLRHFWTSAGTFARPYNQVKWGFLTISTWCLLGIGLFWPLSLHFSFGACVLLFFNCVPALCGLALWNLENAQSTHLKNVTKYIVVETKQLWTWGKKLNVCTLRYWINM